MPDDAPSAASSPAPEPLAPVDLGSLSQPERENWRLTGDLPAPETPETDTASPSSPADSTPAAPAVQAASTEALPSPASEPGKPPPPNAESRVKELLAERHALRMQLEALERSRQVVTPPAASSPAPDAPFPAFDVWSEQHPAKSWDDYNRDLAAHTAEQTYQRLHRAEQERQSAERQTYERQSRAEGFAKAYGEAVAADASIATRISPDVSALRPLDVLTPGETPTALNVVAQELLLSPQAVPLMVYLSEHPEDLAALSRLPNDAAIARAMGRLEARVEAGVSTPPVAPKTVSTAPAPGTSLGRRPAMPADELQAAIRDGDTGRYIKLANAREMAAK